MNFSGRPPAPKNPKIRSSQNVSFYCQKHPYCELCRLDGTYATAGLELHHILAGDSRTDEIWNLIRLCQKHHRDCTEHLNGEQAKRANYICFAVKYRKNEISEKRLTILGIWDYISVILELLPKKVN